MKTEIVDQDELQLLSVDESEVVDQDELQLLDETNSEWVEAWNKLLQSKAK